MCKESNHHQKIHTDNIRLYSHIQVTKMQNCINMIVSIIVHRLSLSINLCVINAVSQTKFPSEKIKETSIDSRND